MKRRLQIFLMMWLLWTCACAGDGARNENAGASNSSATPAGAPNSSAAPAQPGSDRGRSVLQVGGGTVSVEYGRPALRGRDLEKMISPGQEWRMGSNEATTLTSDVDLKFGDRLVPKGTHVLKARASDQRTWHLLVQTEDGNQVAEVPLTLEKVSESAELMTIDLKQKGAGGRFTLHWGNLTLAADFQKA